MYKRRYAAKRKLIRRKRLVRRRYVSKRKAPSTGGFYVKRRVPLFGINGSATVAGAVSTTNNTIVSLGTAVASPNGLPNMYDVPFSLELHLNDLDGASDITNIADKYRIVNTVIKCTTVNGAGYGMTPQPFIEYVKDHDDSVAPTISQLNQKMGLINKGFNQRGQLSMYFKPLPAVTLYNGISSGYAVPSRSPYINTVNNAVPHYFMKGVICNMLLAGTSYNATTVSFDMSVCVHAKDLQ